MLLTVCRLGNESVVLLRGRISRGRMRGNTYPLIFDELHFCYFDALIRADFYTTHATNALSCLIGISLAVGAHLVNLNRTNVHAFSTAGAAIHVDVY
jgi:hypothetical protein